MFDYSNLNKQFTMTLKQSNFKIKPNDHLQVSTLCDKHRPVNSLFIHKLSTEPLKNALKAF